jgi:hypothetical protein
MNNALRQKSSPIKALVSGLVLIFICVSVSYGVARWVVCRAGNPCAMPDCKPAVGLYESLGLTDVERQKIQAFDVDYQMKRAALKKDFNAQIAQLAAILKQTDTYSESVTHAVHALHGVHGELQQLSIEHYYQMLGVLPPVKQEKLRALAVEALSQPE